MGRSTRMPSTLHTSRRIPCARFRDAARPDPKMMPLKRSRPHLLTNTSSPPYNPFVSGLEATKKRQRTNTGFDKGTGYAGKTGAEWKGPSANMLDHKKKVDKAMAQWLAEIRCYIVRTKESTCESWPCSLQSRLGNQILSSGACTEGAVFGVEGCAAHMRVWY